jgi:hypothetical protein
MRRIAKWRPGIENPGGGKIEAKALADAGDQQAGTTYTADLLRRYPGGTEKRSIFATVFGSMPNTRAACRWLIPSTWQARRTRA